MNWGEKASWLPSKNEIGEAVEQSDHTHTNTNKGTNLKHRTRRKERKKEERKKGRKKDDG